MKSKGLKRTDIPEYIIPRFWSRVDVGGTDECWPWKGTFRNKGKYGQIGFKGRYYGSHTVAFVISKHDIPEGFCALHTCDNPPCCNPKHLVSGTKGQNNTDRKDKARNGDHKGEKNGRSILTKDDVTAIRKLGPWFPYKQLAKDYGVKPITIAKICNRSLWAHVP